MADDCDSRRHYCIHKNRDGRDIYYFANSTDDDVNTYAALRGRVTPQLWDPFSREIMKIAQVEYTKKNGQEYTRFPLKLKPVATVFVIGGERGAYSYICGNFGKSPLS